ncbi:MAG: hypothetical protein KGL46_06680 [Hyphomicrobiales bacterium]|nr:hypothetical protein [Hyphomicrobiales bacterium]
MTMALGEMGLKAAAFCAALALCAPAAAFEIGESPFEVMLKWRPTREIPPPPAFVARTRPQPQTLDYQPIIKHDEGRPLKSQRQVDGEVRRLEGAAARNRARAGGGKTQAQRQAEIRALQAAGARNRALAAQMNSGRHPWKPARAK